MKIPNNVSQEVVRLVVESSLRRNWIGFESLDSANRKLCCEAFQCLGDELQEYLLWTMFENLTKKERNFMRVMKPSTEFSSKLFDLFTEDMKEILNIEAELFGL